MPRMFKITYESAPRLIHFPVSIKQGNIEQNDIMAIVDTGATNCSISQRVIDILGLAPSGEKVLVEFGDFSYRDLYLIDLVLPSDIVIKDISFTSHSSSTDILIGMDVISKSHFSMHSSGDKLIVEMRFK